MESKATENVPDANLEEAVMDMDMDEPEFLEFAHLVSPRKVAFYGVDSSHQTRTRIGTQRVIIRNIIKEHVENV